MGVGAGQLSFPLRFVADGFHLLHRKLRRARVISHRHHSSGGHQLDLIRSPLEILPGSRPSGVRAVHDDAHGSSSAYIGIKMGIGVSAGGAQRHAAAEDSGAFHQAFLDGVS